MARLYDIILSVRRKLVGKIGGLASEEVILELVGSKCLPVIFYGLECYPLIKSDLSSLDFVITRALVKLFKSANVSLINDSLSLIHI